MEQHYQLEKLLQYNTSVQVYDETKQVVLDEFCNGIIVKNTGNTLLVFQGDTLQPTESKSIGGNRGEVYTGRIDLNFILPTPAPATPVNQATVTQKFYVNIPNR